MPCLFRQFAEHATNALALMDAHGKLVYANASFRSAFLADGDLDGAMLAHVPPKKLTTAEICPPPCETPAPCSTVCPAQPLQKPPCGHTEPTPQTDSPAPALPPALTSVLSAALARTKREGTAQTLPWGHNAAARPVPPPDNTTPVARGNGPASRPKDSARSSDGTNTAETPGFVRIIPDETTGLFIVEIASPSAPSLPDEALRAERQARRQAERLHLRSRELFFNVIDELPIFVYMQRPDYTVAYANKKTKNFYGETEGRRCYEVFSGLDRPCSFCPTFQVFSSGRSEDWEFTDSKGRTFHIYDYPFEDENGAPLVMELGVDVTELKRVERELFQAQKMRAIGVLAGGIAHDLNNNLVPIIFNIDHALGKLHDAETSEPLSEALRAAYRAAELVEQVLEYSRQQNLSRTPLHLVPLAQENLALLQASLPRGIGLEVEYATEADCIVANPAQVQQLLLNLCRNAVQAMPNGGRLTVSVSNMQIQAQMQHPHLGIPSGEYVVLRITDTGHGIEPDRLEQIFEPFYTSKRNSGGTGMGLAVVHAIVTSNGGRIFVDSTVGKGTMFTVYLPSVRPVAKKNIAPKPATTPVHSRNTRVLLVDDDHGAMMAMRRVLMEVGVEVLTAASGEEGLNRYRTDPQGFDLVLADQSMPGMQGMELARRIRDYNTKARIVICTGHVSPSLEQDASEAGIAGFLMKPMSPARLIESIHRLCGKTRAGRHYGSNTDY